MPIPVSEVEARPYEKEARSKNQAKVTEVLRKDPMLAWTIRELQEEAKIKYSAATLVAVNALEKKGKVEKFVNEEDKVTYVHWIGDGDKKVLVTKERQYIVEEDELE